MANFYPRMQKTAERLLKKYGAEFQVKRSGRHWVDEEGREHHELEKRFNTVGLKTRYNPNEIDGSLILSTDIKMVFSPDIEIKKGDHVLVDSVWLRVIEPNPIKPADIVLCYQSQLRA
ncbi:hypothetical protein [Xenorhabdus griffiniae]|uniref:Phage protein n=1 Tax=Xenorhabdus griffiniae TaxID=351672 RepID=A0ABY9XKR5_9GAMM|nr:hypothetical protein [Xenorhabdus griffiniae]MBD1228659.1 hypothetical protein [Xenorhabdus griffiniae]MBE8588191.1 hypothetical protein [Xenorhabdus griffiniae]WMV73536.1 hypothetical protein QL128_05810 [Xenorhabdus griffiniae]WNH03216.1 hypothetical protein QL112_005815 [Xenorhabdus griffiniae]